MKIDLEHWSWNLSPREAAADARENHWTWEEVLEAMKRAGFPERNIDAVAAAMGRSCQHCGRYATPRRSA